MAQETGVAYRLRKAIPDDLAALTTLRNTADVRAVSRRRQVLDPDEYAQELLDSIGDQNAEVFTIDVAGAFAGYVRIDPVAEGRFEIGVAVDPSWRGRGLAARAVAEAARSFLDARPGAELVALIRPENLASARTFAAAGFRPAGVSGELDVYRYRGRVRSRDGQNVAVVQARTGSTRFPGKVLADIGGAPLLTRLLGRLRRSASIDAVAVATSTEAADDAVAKLASDAGFQVVRGPLDDVLERFRLAAEALDADGVVRVTGDCPLLDPGLVDLVVARFLETRASYVSNVHPPTFPDGLDVEVVAREALEQAAAEATDPDDREHVTLYLSQRPDRFPHSNVAGSTDLSAMRWTVDYPDDLEFVRAVFERFAGREEAFTYLDVVTELERDPGLSALMPGHERNEKLGSHDRRP